MLFQRMILDYSFDKKVYMTDQFMDIQEMIDYINQKFHFRKEFIRNDIIQYVFDNEKRTYVYNDIKIVSKGYKKPKRIICAISVQPDYYYRLKFYYKLKYKQLLYHPIIKINTIGQLFKEREILWRYVTFNTIIHEKEWILHDISKSSNLWSYN